jgi:hypothetical protein
MGARGRGFLNIRQNKGWSKISLAFSLCQVRRSDGNKMNYPALIHGVSKNDRKYLNADSYEELSPTEVVTSIARSS